MNGTSTKRFPCLLALVLVFCLPLSLVLADSLGSAFTYQGRLYSGDAPATGRYDLSFAAYDAISSGRQAGPTLTNNAVSVTNGLFIVTLDFGTIFDGNPRWLAISVRTNGAETYTELSPRQQLTPQPYALYAPNAGVATQATTVAPASLTSAAFAPGAVTSSALAPGLIPSGLAGNPFTTNGPRMNGFVFIGESLSSIYGYYLETPSQANVAWPQQLLSQSNYVFHLPSYYLAKGGTKASDWVATYYASLVHPLAPFPPNQYYGFIMIGINDISAPDTEENITNNIASLWTRMQADGLIVVAHTIPPAFTWPAARWPVWTNVNNDLRTMASARSIILLDAAATITNSAQTVDGVHWTAQQETNYAVWVSQNFNPTYSGIWGQDYPPSDFPGTTRFGGISQFKQGLYVQGDPGAVPPRGQGKLLWLYQYNGTLEDTGAIIAAVDTSTGKPSPLTIYAGNLNLLALPPSGVYVTLPNALGTQARIGGTIYAQAFPMAGAGPGATNLMSYTIPGNTLTNLLDTLEIETMGTFSLAGDPKRLMLLYGSSTVLDSGIQSVSNTAWRIHSSITRTGNTSQYAATTLTWGNAPFALTNWTVNIGETNGIPTTLQVVGTSSLSSTITNEAIFVKMWPKP